MAMTLVDVAAYGADPTGVSDSTAAFQAAIDAATGAAPPATHTRTPTAPVYVPPGLYRITSDISIRSVSGFRLMGAGIGQTAIYAHGSGFTQAAIFIDGSSDGVYEGFSLIGDGTESAGGGNLPDGIRLDWTTAACRSTSANLFRDIRILGLKAVTALSLQGNGARQVDGTMMHNVVVTGGQTPGSWSSSGLWQNGFLFGDGTFANNYNHVQSSCGAALFYNGWSCQASSFALYGSQPAGNARDFYIVNASQCTISNVQTQNCGTFLVAPSQFSPHPASVSDVLIASNHPSLAGNVMVSLGGGMWEFRNFSMSNIYNGVSWVPGTITASGPASTRPVMAVFDNVIGGGSRTATFSSLTNAYVSLRNYFQYDVTTGNYAVPSAADLSSVYSAGAWVAH